MVIPVVRTSVRRSPNAGDTRSFVSGKRWSEAEEIQEYDGVVWSLTWVSGSPSSGTTFPDGCPSFVPPQDIEHPVLTSYETCHNGTPGQKTVTHHRPVTTIFHRPIPPFVYRYRNSRVTCRKCSKKFPHTRLQSESYDIDTYVCNICPYCDEPECCEIEYEQLSDTMLDKIARQNEQKEKK